MEEDKECREERVKKDEKNSWWIEEKMDGTQENRWLTRKELGAECEKRGLEDEVRSGKLSSMLGGMPEGVDYIGLKLERFW